MSYHNSLDNPQELYGHPGPSLPSTDSRSSSVAYTALALVIAYYLSHHLKYTNHSPSDILWRCLVWLTPRRLIHMLDRPVEHPKGNERDNEGTSIVANTYSSKSNAVRRILGLDGVGLITAVQRTRTLPSLSSAFKTKPLDRLPGLGNWDNSCYQNSVLQSLAALKSFPTFLNDITKTDIPQRTSFALKRLLGRLNDPENAGRTFWTPAELKSMSSWQQQDAQEYFSKLSGQIEKDMTKATKARHTHAQLEDMKAIKSDSASRGPQSAATATQSHPRVASKVQHLPPEVKSLILRNPFEGLLAQRVGCQRCGYVEGLSIVPFNCLTLPLGRDWMYDVRTCLDDYTVLEPISGVECAKCTLSMAKHRLERLLPTLKSTDQASESSISETQKSLLEIFQERLDLVEQALEDEDFSDQALKKCKITAEQRISTTKTRQAVIARPPQSLVIHVNRSNFDERTGVQSKNLANVVFPKQLDLGPWCLGSVADLNCDDRATEHWSVDPSQSMLSEDIDREGSKYELRSVITHYGRHENGHYICYRRSPYPSAHDGEAKDKSSASWWRLSDEDVSQVDEDVVLAQGGVFMLFYELVDVPAPPAKVDQSTSMCAENPESAKIDAADSADDVAKTGHIQFSDNQTLPATVTPEQPTIENTLPTPPATPTPPEPELDTNVQPTAPAAPKTAATPPSTALKAQSPIAEPSETSLPSAPKSQPKSPDEPKPVSPTLPERKQPTTPQPKEIGLPALIKEQQPVSPPAMRTAAPRNGRGRGSRAGKAMGSVAGFVQAN